MSRMSNVLVMFQADTEHTEQMALAVGVGAVEAEASIRLRRPFFSLPSSATLLRPRRRIFNR